VVGLGLEEFVADATIEARPEAGGLLTEGEGGDVRAGRGEMAVELEQLLRSVVQVVERRVGPEEEVVQMRERPRHVLDPPNAAWNKTLQTAKNER